MPPFDLGFRATGTINDVQNDVPSDGPVGKKIHLQS